MPARGPLAARRHARHVSQLKARADTAAGVLSGGEKQMLTMCRTLMGDPELVMIDEPTEGLAPLIVKQVGEMISEIARRGLADPAGGAEAVDRAATSRKRVYVMGHGRIVFEGTPADSRPMTACGASGWRSEPCNVVRPTWLAGIRAATSGSRGRYGRCACALHPVAAHRKSPPPPRQPRPRRAASARESTVAPPPHG